MKTLRRIIPLVALGALFGVCIDTRPPPASLSVGGAEISGLLVRAAAPAQARVLIEQPRELHVRVGPSLERVTEVPRDQLLVAAGLNVVSINAWWARGDAYYTFAVEVEQP